MPGRCACLLRRKGIRSLLEEAPVGPEYTGVARCRHLSGKTYSASMDSPPVLATEATDPVATGVAKDGLFLELVPCLSRLNNPPSNGMKRRARVEEC